MRWLGLDLGTRTIGLATSDEEGIVATPLRTIGRVGVAGDVAAVASVVEEVGAGGLVLGLPLTLEGVEGQAVRRVRAFGEALAARLDCPIHYQDERFSTAAAERVLIAADLSRRRRKQVVDHVAAALILQAFLDRQR